MFNLKKTATAVVLGLSAIGAPLVAFAQDTSAAAGATAVTGLVGGQAGYLTSMIGLALAGVGIGIAVKWVKRAKGAA